MAVVSATKNNTMTEDRLSDLAIEREIAQKLSLEEVVDDFTRTEALA